MSRAKNMARKKLAQRTGTAPIAEEPASAPPEQTAEQPKPPLVQRVTPPYIPFPIDVLPGRIAEFCNEVSTVMGCDPALVAMPILSLGGGIVGNSRKIELRQTWLEAPTIWAVSVADSSSTKTPAYRLVEAPLVAAQMRINNSDNKRHLFLSDCTIETVATAHNGNKRGIILAMDELVGWYGSFTRYRTAGSDVGNWCALWTCGVLKKDRETAENKNILVPDACCSVFGNMTPGNLAGIFATPGLFETGIFFRMLYAMPPGRNDQWHEEDVKEKTLGYWADRFNWLLALEGKFTLTLDPAAKKLWVDYYNWIKHRIDLSQLLVRAALVKLRAYVGRFALLHHLLGCKDTEAGVGRISATSMKAAMRLATWFGDEADRVFLLRGESEFDRDLRNLADQIALRPGGRLSARELQRSNNRRYPDTETAKARLESLVASGYGTLVVDGKHVVFVHASAAAAGPIASIDEPSVPPDPLATTDEPAGQSEEPAARLVETAEPADGEPASSSSPVESSSPASSDEPGSAPEPANLVALLDACDLPDYQRTRILDRCPTLNHLASAAAAERKRIASFLMEEFAVRSHAATRIATAAGEGPLPDRRPEITAALDEIEASLDTTRTQSRICRDCSMEWMPGMPAWPAADHCGCESPARSTIPFAPPANPLKRRRQGASA